MSYAPPPQGPYRTLCLVMALWCLLLVLSHPLRVYFTGVR